MGNNSTIRKTKLSKLPKDRGEFNTPPPKHSTLVVTVKGKRWERAAK